MGRADDTRAFCGTDQGLYLLDTISGEGELVDMEKVIFLYNIDESHVLVGFGSERCSVYKTLPVLSLVPRFKFASPGGGRCTSGCLITSSSEYASLLVLAFQKHLSCVDLHGMALIDKDPDALSGGSPCVRSLSHNYFAAVTDYLKGSLGIHLLKLCSADSKLGFKNLSTTEISNGVWHIESIKVSRGPRILYSSRGEIGLLSFSESVEQLIPYTKIRFDREMIFASLLNFAIRDEMVVILAAAYQEARIYQVIYNTEKGSLAHARAPEISHMNHMFFCRMHQRQIEIHKNHEGIVNIIALEADLEGRRLANLSLRLDS